MTVVFAQNPSNVSGSLKGTDGKPVDFVTVSIIRAKDTAQFFYDPNAVSCRAAGLFLSIFKIWGLNIQTGLNGNHT